MSASAGSVVQQLFQGVDAVVVGGRVRDLLLVALLVERDQAFVVLELVLELLEQLGEQRVLAERLPVAHEQRVARGLAEVGAVERDQHAAADVLLVDGLALEELRVALRV